jgi:hypothetical protein
MNPVDPVARLNMANLFKMMTPYDFDPSPSPEEKAHRAEVNQKRRDLPSSDLLYFKWDDDKYVRLGCFLNSLSVS